MDALWTFLSYLLTRRRSQHYAWRQQAAELSRQVVSLTYQIANHEVSIRHMESTRDRQLVELEKLLKNVREELTHAKSAYTDSEREAMRLNKYVDEVHEENKELKARLKGNLAPPPPPAPPASPEETQSEPTSGPQSWWTDTDWKYAYQGQYGNAEGTSPPPKQAKPVANGNVVEFPPKK